MLEFSSMVLPAPSPYLILTKNTWLAKMITHQMETSGQSNVIKRPHHSAQGRTSHFTMGSPFPLKIAHLYWGIWTPV